MTVQQLTQEIVDSAIYDRAVARMREAGVLLPTLSQLADPQLIDAGILDSLADVGANDARAANLFRVHWFNDASGARRPDTPAYLELPSALTGVAARIVVVLGCHFPMIRAHKVLAAYGCLVPRLVTGRFDPSQNRAVWPSTGNYCRGGIAISRIMGCRGVAVLPEGMSAERFRWLEEWVSEPADIVRTLGSESNVKEIYDKCAELEADDSNVILNQFSEFGNYIVHYACTGRAMEQVFESLRADDPTLSLAAFVAGTGSAGTIGAGDYLKARHGSRIVAVEPVECPTLLYNGYGEHNIQGIGDKHVPFIHNVMNTDIVAGVSDRGSDELDVLFNSDAGREYLVNRRGIDVGVVSKLTHLGFSGIANTLAAIKTARRLDLGEQDVIVTVATDGAELYDSEREKSIAASRFGGRFDQVSAGEVFGQHLLRSDTDHLLELDQRGRQRIFNLGYYTWVEQQGVTLQEFDQRKDQRFWTGLQEQIPVWDELIEEFNRRTGVNQPS